MMERRNFMVGAVLVSAGVPAAAGRLSINAGTNNGSVGMPRLALAVAPIRVESRTIQQKLEFLAKETVRVVKVTAAPSVKFLGWHECLVQSGDTLIECNTRTRFDQHLVATSESIGLDVMALDDGQLLTTFAPAMSKLANLFARNSHGRTVKMARLPLPIPGTGAVAELWSDGDVTVRTIANYDPDNLSMLFSFDMIYGHSEKI